MTEELNTKINFLESEITALKQKVNEIVACLEGNDLSRKVSIDYLYTEEEEAEEEEKEEATEEPEVNPNK